MTRSIRVPTMASTWCRPSDPNPSGPHLVRCTLIQETWPSFLLMSSGGQTSVRIYAQCVKLWTQSSTQKIFFRMRRNQPWALTLTAWT